MVQAILFLPLIGALIAGLFGTKAFRQMGTDAEVYADHAHVAHDDHGDHAHGDHHGYDGPPWPMYLTTGLLCIGAILSWVIFWGFLHEGHDVEINLLPWITSGNLQANWAIRLDALTAVMLVVVNTVSSLVHIYSLGYMSHDENQPRFFAFLSLFTFAIEILRVFAISS